MIGGNGNNLLNSSNTFNINNRHVSSSVTSPSFSSPKSAMFSKPLGADDFAIVDIPGIHKIYFYFNKIKFLF